MYKFQDANYIYFHQVFKNEAERKEKTQCFIKLNSKLWEWETAILAFSFLENEKSISMIIEYYVPSREVSE